MNNTNKQATISLLLAFIMFFSSCSPLSTDVVERTAEKEQEEINALIKQIEDAGLNVDTTDLGVFYIVDTMGAGPFPQFGDTLFMKYTAFFLDGYAFEDSGDYYLNTNGVWEFIFEEGALIPGFEDGIKLLSKSTRLNMIIPSSLAYGSAGTKTIQPYTPLRFETEMVNIKPTGN